MKTIYLIATVLLISFVACKSTREGIRKDYKNTKEDLSDVLIKTPEEIQREKVKLSSDIAAQRARIDQDLERISNKQVAKEEKKDTEYTSAKLEDQLENLDAYTKTISETSDDQWDQVKIDVENSLEQMEDERSELTKRLNATLE